MPDFVIYIQKSTRNFYKLSIKKSLKSAMKYSIINYVCERQTRCPRLHADNNIKRLERSNTYHEVFA